MRKLGLRMTNVTSDPAFSNSNSHAMALFYAQGDDEVRRRCSWSLELTAITDDFFLDVRRMVLYKISCLTHTRHPREPVTVDGAHAQRWFRVTSTPHAARRGFDFLQYRAAGDPWPPVDGRVAHRVSGHKLTINQIIEEWCRRFLQWERERLPSRPS